MREESHLDDMRSAIRGDFERLAERRGGQELMRQPEPEPESGPQLAPEPEAEPEPEPETETEQVLVVEPEPEPEPEHETEHPAAATEMPDETPDEPSQRSFLDRLLGR